MTPEGKVKQAVKKILDAKAPNLWYYMPIPLYNRGVPDLVCCANGQFVGIECKAGNNRMTGIQALTQQKIMAAGGRTWVVNEDNLELFEKWVNDLC